jgi:hypothetical protein
MHNNFECANKCGAVATVLEILRKDCLYDQDYHKLNQVESAMQLIKEIKGEFDVTQEEPK